MKRFSEYLGESLTDEMTTPPSSNASAEARKMRLNYIGFGRYADQTGNIAYVIQNDKLVPYRKKEDIAGMAQKAGPAMGPEDKKAFAIANAVQQGNQALQQVSKQSEQYRRRKDREVMKVNKELVNLYQPELYTPEEVDALIDYTDSLYGPVNRYLYKGFDPGTTPEDAQRITDNIEALDSAFEESGAPFDYTTYTGLSQRYDYRKIQPGNDYIFRGYISSSLDHNVAADVFMFTNGDSGAIGTMLEIDIKKGQKSIYLEGITENETEFETLLPRGTKVKVISGPVLVDAETLTGNKSNGNKIALFKCSIVDE